MLVLLAASLWWLLMQLDRFTPGLHLTDVLPPTLLHSVVMVAGFMPLFFAGFLFTAGPKWLRVPAPTAHDLLPALLLQAGGWLLWLAGGHLSMVMALSGLGLAWFGLCLQFARFWQLIRLSPVADRLHATVVGGAGIVGCISLPGVGLSLWLNAPGLARLWVLTALWGFIVPVFVAVAHRMIPFFTSSAVPLVQVWRPFWVLWLMLGAAAFECLAPWMEWLGLHGPTWLLMRGLLELVAGGLLLWLAWAWGLAQSLKIRLLAMLHIGFVWLGLFYVTSAASHFAGFWLGNVLFEWGSLHALTMGCLGSLVFAMVTRVSCGHSGRALIADNLVWALFWLLQMAVLLRLLAALPGAPAVLVLLAALLWLAVMAPWGLRLMRWYGQPRADGREG